MRFKLIAFLLIVYSCSADIFPQMMGKKRLKPTLLNLLRDQYLSTENTLWSTIASGLETDYVLQQIHSGHANFLSNNFQEIHCYLSTFDPEQRVVHDAIVKISNAVNNTVNRYLHTTRRLFNEGESLSISVVNRDLSKQLDQIYAITGESDFYDTLKMVRVNTEH